MARDTIDGFEPVAQIADVPEGSLIGVVTSRGERVCLVNWKGEISAVSDNCTHQEFPMSDGSLLPNGLIECAWHGAAFDCRTGAVRRPPACEALPLYDVRVEDGVIYVGGRR